MVHSMTQSAHMPAMQLLVVVAVEYVKIYNQYTPFDVVIWDACPLVVATVR